VLEKLPKPPGAKMPYVGGLYYLLLVGELPTEAEALEVEEEWKERGEVPDYVFSVLDAMPCDTHPIPLFSQQYWRCSASRCLHKGTGKG
jgi:citrate synthase